MNPSIAGACVSMAAQGQACAEKVAAAGVWRWLRTGHRHWIARATTRRSWRARWSGELFETSFGNWAQACAQGSLPKAGELVDVLVHARALRLHPDREGVIAQDLHPMGERVRVLLRDAGGHELTAELPSAAASSITPGARYRVEPDAQSLRVFPLS